MRYLLILITFISCQLSLSQKRELHIVLEKSFQNSSELKEEFDNLKIRKRTLKKYKTTIYYGGNRRFKSDEFGNINLEFQGDFCGACSLINSLDLDPDNSYQINSIKSSCKDFYDIEKNKINKTLKREKKHNKSEGILLYEAKEKSLVKLLNIPSVINKSNICNFRIQSNSSDIVEAKIWIEKKDEYGNWKGTEKKLIEIKKGFNSQSLEFDSDGKIFLEYSNSNESECINIVKSEIIVFNYINRVGPIELIHEGNNFDKIKTSISLIDQSSILDSAECGAKYYVSPEYGDKYFFYIKKQVGIESIILEMKDLCSDSELPKCNTRVNPIYLTLDKDPAYTRNRNYDRFVIDTWRFDNADKFSCGDYYLYSYKNKNKKPVREWEITLIPKLNKHSELETNNYSIYKIRFDTCN